ncbi:conjugal transfer protein TraF [Pseudomonadota bacterium]
MLCNPLKNTLLIFFLILSFSFACNKVFAKNEFTPNYSLTGEENTKAYNSQNSNYCESRGLGWHFYCDVKKESPKKEKEKINKPQVEQKTSKLSPTEELEQIQQKLEELKAMAILYPTEANMKAYMKYQQEQVNKASLFSDSWRRTLWSNPELDYLQQRPGSAIGKQAWTDERNKDIDKVIFNLNKRYGIFFIFKSTCNFCHAYSPILKSFSEEYNLKIIPVTLDNGTLPEWSKTLRDTGQLNRLGIQIEQVPATILFDNLNKQVIPIGYGIMTQDELKERIYVLTTMKPGEDY